MTNGHRARLNGVPLGKTRTQSLSDGIFAVAMGLLAFQIQIPQLPGDVDRARLFEAIGAMVPSLLIFGGTFLLAGAFWYLQHVTFHFIRQTNHKLIWINIVFLMFVAGLPFSAGMLSRFPNQPLAYPFYFGDVLALGIMLNWHWHYATRKYMVDPEADMDVLVRLSSRLRVIPTAAALALALGTIHPRLGLGGFVWVLLLEPFIEWWRLRRAARSRTAGVTSVL
jgi:uncharacterized membrane protein